ncbi:MAG: hypothetical protein K2X27_24505 [Candidatus Obscuribacterales bacterium]|nr:hypothetical protein [Candidatus Obscuribacterales bacterium]
MSVLRPLILILTLLSTDLFFGFNSAMAEGYVNSKKSRKDAQNQWEYYKYPLIRWNFHPVTTMPGVRAQLSTTFDPKEDELGRGTLKYTLQISEAPPSQGLGVQLLDANGFKLTEFDIEKDKFHPIPGSNMFEAADQTNCKKLEYKNARDYLIKQSSL